MTGWLDRIGAMIFKEGRQMLRDPGTIAMMFAMPLMQMLIFGYAINGDPRHLPMAIEVNDHSAFTRSIDAGLRNSSYFDVTHVVTRPGEGEALIESGAVQFLVTIPADFSRNLVRGQQPQLLVTADATDPSATGNALGALRETVDRALARDLTGPNAGLAARAGPVDLIVHRAYNPEAITSHNTVPGLLAIILSMTMVMMTALSVTRENEQGTMENLLAMPLRPFEVMVGKIAPYLVVGLVQTVVVFILAWLIFEVPFAGSVLLTLSAALLFSAVSLALGFCISTIAENQVQAIQMSFFYMLPSILLSGFMFPFRGMPTWAQWIGELLPTTHFMRVLRGIMLKGWDAAYALPEIGILLLMLVMLGLVAVFRYRDTVG